MIYLKLLEDKVSSRSRLLTPNVNDPNYRYRIPDVNGENLAIMLVDMFFYGFGAQLDDYDYWEAEDEESGVRIVFWFFAPVVAIEGVGVIQLEKFKEYMKIFDVEITTDKFNIFLRIKAQDVYKITKSVEKDWKVAKSTNRFDL